MPELLLALEKNAVVTLQAPPGSGKSTRVPPCLLNSPLFAAKRLVMLEPRRLAAINVAHRIASEEGEAVGGRIGYSIRFQKKVSSRTRLEIVTEGLLLARMQGNPFLEDISLVIFDEFHERSLHSDTLLALSLYIQRNFRSDLKILIMSATLDLAPILKLAPDAVCISCEGRLHPVSQRYLPATDRDLAIATAKAVQSAYGQEEGDILAFLPGSAEIRRCQRYLAGVMKPEEALLLPLYGDLSFKEQEAALAPAMKRKIVLATNIAETSLTIDGVRVVIDSGVVRRLRFDQSTGLDRLVTEKISKASSIQRAGRAGRTAPGVVYRLWSEFEQTTLLDSDPPEIMIADLAPLSLLIASYGINDMADLPFPQAPPEAAIAEASRLLTLLGAFDGEGRITAVGKKIASFPLHPRLGALLVKGEELGALHLAIDMAALLSARDIMPRRGGGGDLFDQLRMLHEVRQHGGRANAAIDGAAVAEVEKIVLGIRRSINAHESSAPLNLEVVAKLLATSYPDRIAMKREGTGGRYLLANGKGGELAADAAVHAGQFIIALRVDAGQVGDARIYAAVPLTEEIIRELFAERLEKRRKVSWDGVLRRVTVREELSFARLTLESKVASPTRADLKNGLIEAISAGRDGLIFADDDAAAQLRGRVGLLRRIFPDDGWPDLSTADLTLAVADWLPELVDSLDSVQAISAVNLDKVYKIVLGRKRLSQLQEFLPESYTLPCGRKAKISYAEEGEPFLSARLQDLFGVAKTPSIAGGRVQLLVHLLSPAGRPLQVTKDLAGFWSGSYQSVKKEMKGRYPKHNWPEDPLSAPPVRFSGKKS
ncbi:MAG: ATP-dependent helicase HrpB [Geobacteraceae bacterium]|nr:ATP-dependent helicase HrpB [Geobacteraceae bacterium]